MAHFERALSVAEGGIPAPPGQTVNYVEPENNAWRTIPIVWTLLAFAIVLLICRIVSKAMARNNKVQLDDCKSRMSKLWSLADRRVFSILALVSCCFTV